MTTKFENIKSEDIKLNENGDVELSPELTEAVAGGFSPEEEENEGTNNCLNISCAAEMQ
ncbi:hypothetical protein G3495_21495 [Shewanella baltica]|uniref:hypothetical protein n=1 Tax=Shewanella baltica TaxID=62322 RepID=UPI00217E2E7B|nr:hypothetical protein [Shewanella baltica]MCS6237661.1 hypothetical protein [Shewanella baltica]MCS6261424.1 hypothetical protein [Shewanella baltica]MCS6272210.1 hypothetical protein [Shewanella baltica]